MNFKEGQLYKSKVTGKIVLCTKDNGDHFAASIVTKSRYSLNPGEITTYQKEAFTPHTLTLQDLRTGMIVERRDGVKRTFMDIPGIGGAFFKGSNCLNADRYNEDLTHKEYSGFSIKKVYLPKSSYASVCQHTSRATLIWERTPEKVTCKSDLRDGDTLVIRRGSKIIFKEEGISTYTGFGEPNHQLNDDLTNNGIIGEYCDVMKVIRDGKTVFEREEPAIEMTVAEIAEKLNINNLKIVK